jgi:hypothetical protein
MSCATPYSFVINPGFLLIYEVHASEYASLKSSVNGDVDYVLCGVLKHMDMVSVSIQNHL